jgi:hypothetical protein
VTSTLARHYYQMVTVATGKDVMSLKTVVTKGHSNDRWFIDIVEEPL